MPNVRSYEFGDRLYDLIKKMVADAVIGFASDGGLNLGGSEAQDGGTGFAKGQ